jgi:hypothetical protein
MTLASLFIIAILIALLIWDWLFMPKSMRRALWLMATVFAFIGVVSFFPELITAAANQVGVGRGVDLLLYLGLIILIREYFLSRARQSALESQITQLVREIAVNKVQ